MLGKRDCSCKNVNLLLKPSSTDTKLELTLPTITAMSFDGFVINNLICLNLYCRLFFVIEFVSGGDLMYHMQRQRRLPEDHAR